MSKVDVQALEKHCLVFKELLLKLKNKDKINFNINQFCDMYAIYIFTNKEIYIYLWIPIRAEDEYTQVKIFTNVNCKLVWSLFDTGK